MWGEDLIRRTDLKLEFKERLNWLEEVIPDSKNDEELISNYVKKYKSAVKQGKIRSCCPIDSIKFVVALATAYEDKIDLKTAEKSDYATAKLVERAKKEISSNSETEETAKEVYNLLEPKMENYKLGFRIDKKSLEEAYYSRVDKKSLEEAYYSRVDKKSLSILF